MELIADQLISANRYKKIGQNLLAQSSLDLRYTGAIAELLAFD